MAKEILGNFYLPSDIDASQISSFMDEELLVIDGDYIRLTNKGLDLANIVWEEFV